MKRAYQGSVNVRFAVEAAAADEADALAVTFLEKLAAWVDGSLGSPPFAPWVTAWYADAPQPLPLTHDQLWNWNPISSAHEPFDLDDA